jgi:hypothetical protein
MKLFRTNQARVLGVLGAIGFIACGTVLAILPVEVPLKIGAALAAAYFLWLGFQGLSGRWIAFDGCDALIRERAEHIRIPLGEVVTVRTVPIFRYVGTLSIQFQDGSRSRTLVSDQDLTWIMAQVPPRSLTPYWRRRTGQQVGAPNP